MRQHYVEWMLRNTVTWTVYTAQVIGNLQEDKKKKKKKKESTDTAPLAVWEDFAQPGRCRMTGMFSFALFGII